MPNRHRDDRSRIERGYDRQWQKLRAAVLRTEPLCRSCKTRGQIVSATVVDHIIPIREAPKRRLDVTNLQPLCAPCHSRHKQSEDIHGFSVEVDASGWPVDPRHPSNTGRGG